MILFFSAWAIFAFKKSKKKPPPMYIYEQKDWPNFRWDNEKLLPVLAALRGRQGFFLGKMAMLGFEIRLESQLESLVLEAQKSNEIEGHFLPTDQVRSSVARRLGIDAFGLVATERHVDGAVEMMLDATQNFEKKLDAERLFGWHSALFPSGRSGIQKIEIGGWRTGKKGPMQVVSGSVGREKIHFQAPSAQLLEAEMAAFFHFFNEKDQIEPILKAGLAHLWFVTVHPFEDGNGRIARAIADLQLAKTEASPQRFYSISAQIELRRKQYYELLERTQKGGLDVTEWLVWFFECLDGALQMADSMLENVLLKARFWEKNAQTIFNERQVLMLNRLLSGTFEGKLTSSKWAKIAKCSDDTALRDLLDLVKKGAVEKDTAGGRSTSYSFLT